MSDFLLLYTTSISGLLVIYHHLGYPLILRWVRKHSTALVIQWHNRYYTPGIDDIELPTITIVIPAYDEQQWVAEKIRNLAILDYPSNRLKIIFGCDGCTDDTAAIAIKTARETECHHLEIEVRKFPQNRGKVAVINDLVQSAGSELIALSDVSSLVSVDALLIAAAHFNNANIGVVNGQYRLLNPGTNGEKIYWQYQGHIKASEAALGSTLGAHGAFYLFRRSLFSPLAPDTINDDFILPMKIVEAGYRAEYESRIQLLELEQADDKIDHQRRRRIAAGNCQQLLRLKKMMLPRYGRIAFAFTSGKGLRVLMPYLMITTFFGSAILAGNYILFAILASLQSLAYLLAGWQILLRPKRSPRLMRVLAYLVSGHAAGLVGSIRYLIGLERGRWKPVRPI